MSSDLVVDANNLQKCYHIYSRPIDRLLQMILGRRRQFFREFWALRDVSITVRKGDCLGVVGRNGAGKSTFLQLICGTLNPSGGSLKVRGRIAALLELGAGFNPEFSGRENVILSAAVIGLTPDEIAARYDEIVEFSGIGEFIDQPVKTYSSGMYVRLAFAIATSVDPDLLVIDEALSVGDGEFSRKSFERIMSLRDRGVTILFCSHSLYQVEAMCSRALWLDAGRVVLQGEPAEVVSRYGADLARSLPENHGPERVQTYLGETSSPLVAKGTARIVNIEAFADGCKGTCLTLHTGQTDFALAVHFSADPSLPPPSLGVIIYAEAGHVVTSAGSKNDSFELVMDKNGNGYAEISFPCIPLLKGEYSLSVHLLCERAMHTYDIAEPPITLKVSQSGLELGFFRLPHSWKSSTGTSNNSEKTCKG